MKTLQIKFWNLVFHILVHILKLDGVAWNLSRKVKLTWCEYPNVFEPCFGCWSLLRNKCPEACKKCELNKDNV